VGPELAAAENDLFEAQSRLDAVKDKVMYVREELLKETAVDTSEFPVLCRSVTEIGLAKRSSTCLTNDGIYFVANLVQYSETQTLESTRGRLINPP